MNTENYADYRDRARDAIASCINELANQNIPYQQITSALIEASLEIVSNERFEIIYPSDLNQNDTDDCGQFVNISFNEKYTDETEEEHLERIAYEEHLEMKDKFDESPANKKFEKLRREAWKFKEMENYNKYLNSQMKILKFAPEHIKSYMEIVGIPFINNYDARYLSDIETVIKSQVVLQQPEKIEMIYSISSQIGELLPEEVFDLEILQSKQALIYEHLNTFKLIKEFLKINPSFKQRDLFKALSLDSRKINYLFVLAEKFMVIKRKRNGDSWILNIA